MANGNSTSEVQQVYAERIKRDKKPIHIHNGVFTRPVPIIVPPVFVRLYRFSVDLSKGSKPEPHYHSANSAARLDEITRELGNNIDLSL